VKNYRLKWSIDPGKSHWAQAALQLENLHGGKLGGANLSGAALGGALLDNSDFTDAVVGRTMFGENDLSIVKGLAAVLHFACASPISHLPEDN
jgi:uncharacterized protein YjbI with pentapeptide repeats